ncbi:MAG: hypothetical protein ACREVL_00735 [Solimonas sp.]
MTLDQVFALAAEAKKLTRHSELVVIGSNSILGLAPYITVPEQMSMSTDLDAYLKLDPKTAPAISPPRSASRAPTTIRPASFSTSSAPAC